MSLSLHNPSGNAGGEAFEVRTSGLGRWRPSCPRLVESRGAKAHEAYFSPKCPYSRARQRRITPSRTCHGRPVPFVKRRAATVYARWHSSNRDNIGTPPGSSRAGDSGFRCVNAEVNASNCQRWAPQIAAAKFVSWEQGLTGNENL